MVYLSNEKTLSPSVFTAEESSAINYALTLIEGKRLRGRKFLPGSVDVERYMMMKFAGLTNEQGLVIYLSGGKLMLKAEMEFFGNQNSVGFDLRRVVMRAIMLGAEYVVFAHNHPSNNPEPSEADRMMFGSAQYVFGSLGMTVLESYVVTASGCTAISENIEARRKDFAAQVRRERAEKLGERRAKVAAPRARKGREALPCGVAA